MNARTSICVVAAAVCLWVCGCLSRPTQPRFRPDKTVDLFADVKLAEGADVVRLNEPEQRTAPKPLSFTAPEYKLLPGDMVEVIYQTAYDKDPEEYLIDVEDELVIEVLYNPDLSRRVRVRPDGRITLPMIGDHFVLGKTSSQAAAELRLLYSRYLRDPEVHIAVDRYNVKLDELKKAIATTTGGQSKSIRVRPDGRVSLPMIGEVNAAGFTIPEALAEVQKRYAGVVHNLKVSMGLVEINTPQVYVIGQVTAPGAYPINGRITTAQAITLAGGALDNGDLRRVTLVKSEGAEESKSCQINVRKLLDEGRLDKDPAVERNDVVYVPRTQPPTIYVAGEVNLPGAYPYEPGMDIFDAMAMGQGALGTANLCSVVVIRSSNVSRPVAFRVDMTRTLFKGDTRYNLKLEPYDAIYFPKTFIARVDQWIDQWLTTGLYAAFPSDSSLDFFLDAKDVKDQIQLGLKNVSATGGSVRSR